MGRGISNYPDWVSWNEMTRKLACKGVSEWMDWQDEQGRLLHDYVPDIAISDDYTGKFRLHIDGQAVAIQFNDADCTVVCMIYNWIGDYYHTCTGGTDHSWEIPQADPDNYFEYDCYCKQKGTDPAVESNKAHVKLTRLRGDDGEDIGFNYLLTVNNKTLIDVDLKVPVSASWFIKFSEKHQWLNNGILANNSSKTAYGIIAHDDAIGLDSFWALMVLNNGPGNIPIKDDDRIEKYIYYCFEGISLRYIDDATQTVQFNLLDADKSDFADYVEVVKTGDKAKLTYYKLVNGNPVVVRAYDNLDSIDEIGDIW